MACFGRQQGHCAEMLWPAGPPGMGCSAPFGGWGLIPVKEREAPRAETFCWRITLLSSVTCL